MRKPHEIVVDRALLLHILQLVEAYGLMTDVKLQQLTFLSELKLFDRQLKALHFEFFRYAYGAFSKDLDNDLLWLRRRGRLDNFTVSEKAQGVLKLLDEAWRVDETARNVGETLQAVLSTYGPQDASAVTAAVERVELSTPEQPLAAIRIGDISFHSTLLVPTRIQVQAEFALPPRTIARLNAALGAE
jgi:hypothetical protein